MAYIAFMIDVAEILANAIDGPICDLIEAPDITNIFAPPSPLLFSLKSPASQHGTPRQYIPEVFVHY